MSDTRQRILAVARALFNERGLHRVGVRDLARELGISPGNLAYHFPTKDDLVSALVLELHELNARTVFAELPDDFSVVTLYRAAVATMRNMLEYRFVLLSYVDAVRASPELSKMDARLHEKRRRRANDMINRLADNGHLHRRRFSARADHVHEQCEMISSGWLTAHALHPERRSEQAAVLHYAKLGCVLLEPYLTDKGARQMRRILRGAYDEELMQTTAEFQTTRREEQRL